VDLSDSAAAWLQTFIELRGIQSGLIVPFTPAVLRQRRKANQKAAGVKKWIQQGLRHTYCTNWLALHKDVNKLVLQSGHDSVETTWRNYQRGTTEAEAQKFWNIQPPTVATNIVPMARAS
jgi:integrase